MASDGSDLTRWNVARSLAGDILAAVADEDRRGDDETNDSESAYDYASLLNDHPNRQLPSEEALRTGVGVVLCAVDASHLDFSMSDEADPTTRSRGAALAMVDDRPALRNDEDPDEGAPLWSRAVNLLARWLMSGRSGIRVGGEVRHRLNSWNEARHLASRFVAVEEGGMSYEEATEEWPDTEFPSEDTTFTVVREAETTTDDKQHCIDEVARWVKSLDWLERDRRDSNRIAMGGSGDERGAAETPSIVLKQTDQLTLTGDVQPNEPRMLGQFTGGSTEDVTGDENTDAGDESNEDDTDVDDGTTETHDREREAGIGSASSERSSPEMPVPPRSDAIGSTHDADGAGQTQLETVSTDSSESDAKSAEETGTETSSETGDGCPDDETDEDEEDETSRTEIPVADSSGENRTLTGCMETACSDTER